MDTYMTLTAYGEHAQEAVDKAAERVEALDALLSTGNENSEIYQLNQNGEATLSEEGGYLVERALELYKKTEGAYCDLSGDAGVGISNAGLSCAG